MIFDRRIVFLYEHMDLKADSPMTMGRYWMAGLLLSGFLTLFYLVVRLGLKLLLRPYENPHRHLDCADYDRDLR